MQRLLRSETFGNLAKIDFARAFCADRIPSESFGILTSVTGKRYQRAFVNCLGEFEAVGD